MQLLFAAGFGGWTRGGKLEIPVVGWWAGCCSGIWKVESAGEERLLIQMGASVSCTGLRSDERVVNIWARALCVCGQSKPHPGLHPSSGVGPHGRPFTPGKLQDASIRLRKVNASRTVHAELSVGATRKGFSVEGSDTSQ